MNFDLSAHRSWQYDLENGQHGLLAQALLDLQGVERQQKKFGPRQQAVTTDLCYFMKPLHDRFDQNPQVLVADKYGTVAINLKTKQVQQLQVWENQAV